VPTLRFGAVTFMYDAKTGFGVTQFPDSAKLPAAPEDTEAYRATARELGYGDDVRRMCIEHEASHSFLAHAAGLPFSPTLYGEAVGRHTLGTAERHREERRVLDWQRYLNTGEVSAALAEYLAGAGVTAVELRERWEKALK
jgi:hypothetical protein